MVDKSAGRRKRRTAAPLLALVGILVLVAAGCGGKSADQKASEAYANSVCTAIAGWQTQVKSITTDLSGGISRASLQSKVTRVESATKSLVTQIKTIPLPNTSQGQTTRQQLDQLSANLTSTVASIKAAFAGLQTDASAGTVAAAVLTLAPQVKTLATSAQSTISTLKSSEEARSSAFKNAESCQSLGGSG
ncbi:MAG TPA: hypothetical protein VH419_15230 [Nocardioidaceae bacterium]